MLCPWRQPRCLSHCLFHSRLLSLVTVDRFNIMEHLAESCCGRKLWLLYLFSPFRLHFCEMNTLTQKHAGFTCDSRSPPCSWLFTWSPAVLSTLSDFAVWCICSTGEFVLRFRRDHSVPRQALCHCRTMSQMVQSICHWHFTREDMILETLFVYKWMIKRIYSIIRASEVVLVLFIFLKKTGNNC